MSLWLQIFLFSCIGVAIEVFFTAISKLVTAWKEKKYSKKSLRLMGYSYVWMFPIYGLIPLIAPFLLQEFANLHVLVRLLLYAIVLMGIEGVL